jgi:positive regulator of sigma E activity
LRCSKCKAIKYCGKECQNEDWKEHKQTCFQIPQ